VTELGRDYFHFDQVRHAMIGERSGRVFQLAGRVSVVVARVDLERAKIDFSLAPEAAGEAGVASAPQRPVFAEPLATDSARVAKRGPGAKPPRDEERERRSPRGKRRR
jgi:ribonuclease R